MTEVENYKHDAHQHAIAFIQEFLLEQIAEKLTEGGEASTDLYNDYGGADAYHHDYNTDKWWSFEDAALIISQLRDYEESDTGLWHGLEMREALSACAAHTFGNAVMSMTIALVEKINDYYDDMLFDQRAEQDEEAEGYEELEALSLADTKAAIEFVCETEGGEYE